jgi:hypothetical protein
LHAGVVHQHADRTEGTDRGIDSAAHLVGSRDIAAEELRLLANLLRQGAAMSSTSNSATFAPSRAKARAVAWPIPLAAPVTITT